MSRKEAYGYAVARIRAMEHRLLDAAVFTRLLEAEDSASVLKILGETSYAPLLTSLSGGSFDKILEASLLETYEELTSFVPDRELPLMMRMQYDFSNVKVMLKSMFAARSGGKKRWDLLTSLASYPVDDLVSKIEAEEYRLLPFGLSSVLPKCIAVWEQSKNTLETERLLDLQMFGEMRRMAEELGFSEVTEWVKARIDGENLRTLLRLKRFGFDASGAASFLHEGGRIDRDLLASMIAEPFETWGRLVSFSDLSRLLSETDVTAGFSQIIMDFEKKLDEYLLDLAAASRYSPDSPCNVIAYLWSKELEVKNIRMVLVSKSGSGDRESVRRLLRHV